MNVTGLKIVILGDSHTQTALGKGLEKALTAAGAKVTNVGIGGTSAEQWLKPVTCFPGKDKDGCKPDSKRTRLGELGPFDLAIISLGTNDGANASADGRPNGIDASKFPEQLLKVAARAAPLLFYVGPPALRGAPMPPGKSGKRPKQHYTDANVQPYFDAVRNVIGEAAIDSFQATRPFVSADGDGVHFYSSKTGGGKAWVDAVMSAILARTPYIVRRGVDVTEPPASTPPAKTPPPTPAGDEPPGVKASSVGTGVLVALGLGAAAWWFLRGRR